MTAICALLPLPAHRTTGAAHAGGREVGSFEMALQGPFLSLSAVPVHPSLMRQFQFQSRLRITETGTVLQIPILAMETISQSQRATHMTPLALCQQCQRVPSQAPECHVRVNRCQLHWAGARCRARRRRGRPKLMGTLPGFRHHGDGRATHDRVTTTMREASLERELGRLGFSRFSHRVGALRIAATARQKLQMRSDARSETKTARLESPDSLAAPVAGKTCGQRAIRASLVQPCGFKRLIDVSPLAPDDLRDLSGAHSFLAQRYDACAVEGDRAALVNALRFRGLDAGALPIAEKPSSISATMPSTMRTMRPIGPPVSMAAPTYCGLLFFFQFVHDVENVPGAFPPKRSNWTQRRGLRHGELSRGSTMPHGSSEGGRALCINVVGYLGPLTIAIAGGSHS
jgi:hypothetical protein